MSNKFFDVIEYTRFLDRKLSKGNTGTISYVRIAEKYPVLKDFKCDKKEFFRINYFEGKQYIYSWILCCVENDLQVFDCDCKRLTNDIEIIEVVISVNMRKSYALVKDITSEIIFKIPVKLNQTARDTTLDKDVTDLNKVKRYLGTTSLRPTFLKELSINTVYSVKKAHQECNKFGYNYIDVLDNDSGKIIEKVTCNHDLQGNLEIFKDGFDFTIEEIKMVDGKCNVITRLTDEYLDKLDVVTELD